MFEKACCDKNMVEPFTCGQLRLDVQRLTTQLADRDAEIDQLRVQLAGCGVAAMCNTRESMQQQLCRKGDYGYSASYQDVVDAVSREIVLREENTTLRAKLAECEKEAERLAKEMLIQRLHAGLFHNSKRIEARKQAARECMRVCDDLEDEGYHYETCCHLTVRDRIKAKFGLEG